MTVNYFILIKIILALIREREREKERKRGEREREKKESERSIPLWIFCMDIKNLDEAESDIKSPTD